MLKILLKQIFEIQRKFTSECIGMKEQDIKGLYTCYLEFIWLSVPVG